MTIKDFDKKLLDKFTGGSYSRSEYCSVKQWFEQVDCDELCEAVQAHWAKIPVDQPLDGRLIKLFEILETRIGSPPLQHFTEAKKIGQSKAVIILNFYKKVAAILFIPLLSYFIYWTFITEQVEQQPLVTIHSPEGARTEFVLPDGTTGWLNSGSTLVYPVVFEQDREVEVNGEAYFKVTHKNGKKFRVKTGSLMVQVLGTSFNVAAYDEDDEISITLETGKVQISDGNVRKDFIISPDEKLIYNKEQKTATIRKVNALQQISWTRGLLRFDIEPLSEVMKKLARWHNVDIEILDKQLQEYNFKATFEDEQLDEILRIIAITTPMKYRIEDRKIDENGIYMKRKVVIEKRK